MSSGRSGTNNSGTTICSGLARPAKGMPNFILGKIYINDPLLYGIRRTIYTHLFDFHSVMMRVRRAVGAVEA
jgi:hypothetical protein